MAFHPSSDRADLLTGTAIFTPIGIVSAGTDAYEARGGKRERGWPLVLFSLESKRAARLQA
jgi:hypothetical protein